MEVANTLDYFYRSVTDEEKSCFYNIETNVIKLFSLSAGQVNEGGKPN